MTGLLRGLANRVSGRVRRVPGLIDGYRAAGLTAIDHKVYPGGRHEMFNETCREAVEVDLITWLDRTLGA